MTEQGHESARQTITNALHGFSPLTHVFAALAAYPQLQQMGLRTRGVLLSRHACAMALRTSSLTALGRLACAQVRPRHQAFSSLASNSPSMDYIPMPYIEENSVGASAPS